MGADQRASRPQAVLLDRDGTLNVKAPEGEYVLSPTELVLLPGAGTAVRALNDAGLPVFVVTNQRGVARGLLTLETLAQIHDRLATLLAAEGGRLDGIYVCPHAGGSCDCRKPGPGLWHQIQAAHPSLSPQACVVIGDAATDVGFARAMGARAIRLATDPDPLADLTVASLGDAVAAVLSAGG